MKAAFGQRRKTLTQQHQERRVRRHAHPRAISRSAPRTTQRGLSFTSSPPPSRTEQSADGQAGFEQTTGRNNPRLNSCVVSAWVRHAVARRDKPFCPNSPHHRHRHRALAASAPPFEGSTVRVTPREVDRGTSDCRFAIPRPTGGRRDVPTLANPESHIPETPIAQPLPLVERLSPHCVERGPSCPTEVDLQTSHPVHAQAIDVGLFKNIPGMKTCRQHREWTDPQSALVKVGEGCGLGLQVHGKLP